MNNEKILSFVKQNDINLIIVGPEQPLENGIVDFFEEKNIKIFGPSKYASQLETSKLFARYIMEKYNIPQPAFFECTTEEEILSIEGKIGLPIVLKADGLAAGKGVIICTNKLELKQAVDWNIHKRPRRQDKPELYTENGMFYINSYFLTKRNNTRTEGNPDIMGKEAFTVAQKANGL